jgi:hypothetical protein
MAEAPKPAAPAVNPEIANLLSGNAPSIVEQVAAEVGEGQDSLPDLAVEPQYTPDAWAKQTVDGPEPVPAAQPAEPKPAATKPPPGYVPQQALDQTRAEVKEANEKIARMNQRFEDTIRLMQGQRPQAEQPKPPALPDPQEKPIEHMQQRFDRIEQALNAMIGMQQQGMGQAQTVQAIQADEMTFKAKHPDYNNALDFVRNRRAQELTEDLGMSAQQAAQTLANEEMMISMNAMKQGNSPAAAAYKLAQRWGYKNGATVTEQNTQTQADKLKATGEAMQTNKSLGSMAGTAPADTAGMTLEALANLDGEAFTKAFDKLIHGAKNAKSQLPGFLRR